MRVEGTYTFPVDIERVFAAFTNPDALARAIPGCERFIQLGPASVDGGVIYEMRLRTGEPSQTYTVTLRVKSARRPAYLKLDIRGYGPAGAITGAGSLDLVAQEDYTVVAYSFNFAGAEATEGGNASSQSAHFIARATCAHLADELHAQVEDDLVWLRDSEAATDDIATPRGRIVTPLAARYSVGKPPTWTERAIWMTVGLTMGLSVIALAVSIMRRMGSQHDQAS